MCPALCKASHGDLGRGADGDERTGGRTSRDRVSVAGLGVGPTRRSQTRPGVKQVEVSLEELEPEEASAAVAARKGASTVVGIENVEPAEEAGWGQEGRQSRWRGLLRPAMEFLVSRESISHSTAGCGPAALFPLPFHSQTYSTRLSLSGTEIPRRRRRRSARAPAAPRWCTSSSVTTKEQLGSSSGRRTSQRPLACQTTTGGGPITPATARPPGRRHALGRAPSLATAES